MTEEEYLACLRLCEESINGHFQLTAADAAKWGVRFDALSSLRSQLVVRRVRRYDHVHRARRSVYRRQFEGGMHIVDIARQAHVRHPPYLLARLLVEDLCPREQRVVAYMRNTKLIEDLRLRKEVEETIAVDTDCSPIVDRAREEAGAAHERLLERELRERGVCFEAEADLRARGAYRTPDARLLVPAAMFAAETGQWHVVNWVDSKAMFGDPETYRKDHYQQLVSYVDRYGPGMVVYWMDFVNTLNDPAFDRHHPGIVAVGAVPPAAAVVLPEEEPPDAWEAGLERYG